MADGNNKKKIKVRKSANSATYDAKPHTKAESTLGSRHKPVFSRKQGPAVRQDKRGRPGSEALAKVRAERLAKIERTFPIELMMTDFAIKYPDITPYEYICDVKGYSEEEYRVILKKAPTPDWYAARNEIKDAITEKLAKRHIDWAAEMHDLHFRASKISLESAIEWLEHQFKVPVAERDMRMLKTATETVQIAQKIQRTALGLPTDDGAIHIYNKLVMNTDKHVTEMEKTPVEKLEESLTLEEIQELIEHRRMEKRLEREREEHNTIDVTPG